MAQVYSNLPSQREMLSRTSEDDMTRETKIGLLVGLAFIIVIGILLSDHLTSQTNPSGSLSKDPLSSINEGLGTPYRSSIGQNNTPLKPIRPEGQIPFNEQNKPGRVDVGVSPPRDPRDIDRGIVQRPGDQGGQIADGNNGGRTEPPSNPPVNPPAEPHQTEAKYTVQSGDTLWSIARKVYGRNVTQADIDRIIAANPNLNPKRINIKDTIVIPGAAATEDVVDGSAPHGRTVTPPHETGDEDHLDGPSAPTGSAVIYTTKAGDSLWKIAAEQCGTPSRTVVDQIKAMNKDVLKNGETIHPAMKLKLPPKTVASAN